jgi:DNA-binding transcriptional LysR family regulator
MQMPRASPELIRGPVRVGVTYTVAGYFLPRHHDRFRRNYPHVDVELFESPRPSIEHGLIEGSLDLAVMLVSNLEAADGIEAEILLRSRRRLWTPPEHPLLRTPSAGLADVARHPHVMLTVDEAADTAERCWARTSNRPEIVFRTSSVEAVRSMAAADMGVTILSDMVYRPWSLEGQRLETRLLVDNIPTMDVGVAWARDRDKSAAARAFMDFLRLALRIPASSVDPTAKNFHWADLTRGQFEAHDRGADFCLLSDSEGNLTEGAGYNVFFVIAGVVVTPASGMLEGVTRRSVLELCVEQGLSTAVRNVSIREAREADEIFLTTTAGGVMPASRIDGRIMGNDRPGPISSRLRETFWAKRAAGWHATPVDYGAAAEQSDPPVERTRGT